MEDQVTALQSSEKEKAHLRLLGYARQQASPSLLMNNALSLRDRQYKDGKQIPASVAAELDERGQAAVVFNYIQQKVNTLTGMEKIQRRDVVAKPRRRLFQNKADAATYSIRTTLLDQSFDSMASEVFDELVVEGGAVGAYISVIQTAKGNPKIKIDRILWREAIFDNYCLSRDCITAGGRFLGRVKWLDLDVAKRAYPEHADQLLAATSNMTLNSSERQQDIPNIFYETDRQRIAIYELWEKWDNTIYQGIFTEGVLISWEESPYIDEDGNRFAPIELNSAYIDTDGNRYGEVRNLIDPQDEVNFGHKKVVHELNCKQFKINEAQAGAKAADVQAELAKPDGAIKLRDFAGLEILDSSEQVQGHFSLIESAKDFILNTGARSSLSSTAPQASGRAALVEQSAGVAEVGNVFDWHEQWKNRVYKTVWQLQKQFWTEEDWLATLGSEKEVAYVGINQKITEGMKYIEDLEKQGVEITPEIQADADKLTNIVEVRNALPEIFVNFELENSIDAPALQVEQFQILSQLIAASPNIPPARLQLLIEASSFKNKKELLDLLKAEQEQAKTASQSLPPDVQQYIQQLEQQVAANAANLSVEQLKAETDLKVAQLNADNKKEIEAMRAQSDKELQQMKSMLSLVLQKLTDKQAVDVAAEPSGVLPSNS